MFYFSPAVLGTRIEQLRYATFQAKGYPIGSGVVESGNKLVVEARLKGAGMHWERENVNPMLALRGILCSGQWEQAWIGIWQELGRQAQEQRRQGRQRRAAARAEQAAAEAVTPEPPSKRLPPEPKRMVDGRPTAEHPWKNGYDQRRVVKTRTAAKS